LEVQVCIVDLETDEIKVVGDPMDTAHVSWMPDGRRFILLKRVSPAPQALPVPDKPADPSLAILDPDGKLTVLRRGDYPVMLPDYKSILFLDRDSGLWNTCDLEGQNAKPLADGFKGFRFPAPAPDGRRILMMQIQPAPPRGIVFPFGEGDGKPLTDEPGLWGQPAWR
jgi:hypothetical protein